MKKYGGFLSILLASTWLAGCEYTYDYTYTVTNSTDTTILVRLETYRADSFLIEKDSTSVIYITDHGIEARNGPFYHDVREDLKVVLIRKGFTVSRRDYLHNDSWPYDNGTYAATVTESEF